MGDKPKYSIVIPIFNSEKTLARCVESILLQKRQDIQVILIDDGSCDMSGSIALEYQEHNPCIVYIHQDNAGVSRARNVGLEHAKGEFVTFVDSDDFLMDGYFETLDQFHDSELLLFSNGHIGGAALNEKALVEAMNIEGYFGKLAHLVANRTIMPPWNKRYKRSIIEANNLRFIEGLSVGEDFNFCLGYAMCCSTIDIVMDRIICIDVSDQKSLSRKYRPQLSDVICQTFYAATATIHRSGLGKENKEELLSILDYLFVKNVFSCIAEEFKNKRLNYFYDRDQIKTVCQRFQQSFSDRYYNIIHTVIRLMLRCRLYFPFYVVTYLAKGHKALCKKRKCSL